MTGPRGKLDFAAIASAALDAAERLVPDWLREGSQHGVEWRAPNPTRNDKHAGSFSVNLKSGVWSDFATDDKGGDLISLYAYLFTGNDQGKAAKELSDLLRVPRLADGVEPAPKPPEKPRSFWSPVVPVPDDATPAPVAHPHRGKSQRVWKYRNGAGQVLGYVHRFETSDGGKEILPCVWARNGKSGRHEWRWMQWTEPRPLYGLDLLTDKPDRVVLIVEGEKCRDVGVEMLLERFDVISWPGGGKAIQKCDWTPLAGRTVLIWPDCDSQRERIPKDAPEGFVPPLLPEVKQPGIKAAEGIAKILEGLGCKVRIVEIPAPGTVADGWDIADAVAAGETTEGLLEIMRKQRAPAAAEAQEKKSPEAARAPPEEPPDGGDPQVVPWKERLLYRRGEIDSCLANVAIILLNHPAWQGMIGYDEFASRTLKLKRPPSHRVMGDPYWSDYDTSQVTIWLTNNLRITPSSGIVHEAMVVASRANSFHPVRDWLHGLPKWDGTERLDYWLEDFMGVKRTEYTKRVGRWFIIGMVKRVLEPGCQFDYCLVLEGLQGRRKSSVLRALVGDEWFSDADLDLTNKDAMAAIQGKLLHEFAELGALARAESTRQKSFLTRRRDEFRPVYGREIVRCWRQGVFAGTTNEWAWNKDPTGGRRFWPVEVTAQVDVEGMQQARAALFAEALHRVLAGERFYPTTEEQRELFDPEQLQREAEDSYFDPIHDWVDTLNTDTFTLHDVLNDALKLDAGRHTRDVMTRAGQILKKIGCNRIEKRNGVSRFVYTLPDWTKFAKAMAARKAATGAANRDGAAA